MVRQSTVVSIMALLAYFGGISYLVNKGVPLWFTVLVIVFGSIFAILCVLVAAGQDAADKNE